MGSSPCPPSVYLSTVGKGFCRRQSIVDSLAGGNGRKRGPTMAEPSELCEQNKEVCTEHRSFFQCFCPLLTFTYQFVCDLDDLTITVFLGSFSPLPLERVNFSLTREHTGEH